MPYGSPPNYQLTQRAKYWVVAPHLRTKFSSNLYLGQLCPGTNWGGALIELDVLYNYLTLREKVAV